MPEDTRWGNGAMLALGFLTGAAAALALLATRLRVYHHGDCPECGVALVVSYEPVDAEPQIRREAEVEHPPDSRVGQLVQRARQHPRQPSRTVVIIG
jgi:hypothetical protein